MLPFGGQALACSEGVHPGAWHQHLSSHEGLGCRMGNRQTFWSYSSLTIQQFTHL